MPRRKVEHEITQRKTPLSYLLVCTCGWSHSETRRQNAWARAAKLRSAEAAHWRAVEAQENEHD